MGISTAIEAFNRGNETSTIDNIIQNTNLYTKRCETYNKKQNMALLGALFLTGTY